MSSSPIIIVDDNDFNITNNNDVINSTSPLLSPTFNNNNNAKLSSSYRWLILLGFSLFTFASACMWITFAPCLYIFMSYFSQTPSSINSLSSIYLLLYPILFIPSSKFFNTYGIKFGVIFGAFLNSLGALLRYLGSLKRSYIGFWILFLGQTIAALAQLFILCVPPKLANIWFSQYGQQNFATSVGITANSAGVAIGFLLSPWMIKEKTANHDIPNYLLLQFIVCAMIYLFLIFTFKSSPDKRTNSRTMPLSTTNLNISDYFSDKMFMILTISFGIVTGGEYAFATLLSQIILPVFEKFDEVIIINYQVKALYVHITILLFFSYITFSLIFNFNQVDGWVFRIFHSNCRNGWILSNWNISGSHVGL